MYADIVATVLNNPDKFGELAIFSITYHMQIEIVR